MEKRKAGRKKGQVPLDYIRHGYRKKNLLELRLDEKKNEDWFFYPKYKANEKQRTEKRDKRTNKQKVVLSLTDNNMSIGECYKQSVKVDE